MPERPLAWLLERKSVKAILFFPHAELIVLLSCLLAMSAMTESEDDSSCNAFEITQISLSSIVNRPSPCPTPVVGETVKS